MLLDPEHPFAGEPVRLAETGEAWGYAAQFTAEPIHGIDLTAQLSELHRLSSAAMVVPGTTGRKNVNDHVLVPTLLRAGKARDGTRPRISVTRSGEQAKPVRLKTNRC